MALDDYKWVSKRNLQTFWNSIKGSIFGDLADIVPTGESVKAFSAGDLMTYGSHLYKALTSIAIGDELVPGTNIARTTVDAELNSLDAAIATKYDPKLANILGDLATVEAEMAATQNYNKGDYIVIGDYFYKATDAITSGDTLTVGTNIALTNVGAEVSELNSKMVFANLSFFEVRSMNRVISLIFNSQNPTVESPSVWMDINVANKLFNVYKDIGSGWVKVGETYLT